MQGFPAHFQPLAPQALALAALLAHNGPLGSDGREPVPLTRRRDVGGRAVRKLIEQIMKFGVVGVIAFVIDYGLMVLLTEAFGVDYLASATISFVVSVTFNYFASMRYVFTHRKGMSRRREFAIFVILSVAGLIINDACMYLGTGLLAIDYRVTKIGATVIVMVWNFVTRKKFLDAGDEAEQAEESLEHVVREARGAADAGVRDGRPGR